MTIIHSLLAVIYLISLLFVLIYCSAQFYLLLKYLMKDRSRNNTPDPDKTLYLNDPSLPFVTLQLPVYNEKYVAGRLIDSVMGLQYPIDKFEVHILDDSTDETLKISQEKADYYSSQGYNIRVISRTNRKGYKAGALKEAMEFANGKIIGIFDADFLPHSDFLLRTVGSFEDPQVGVVQTRWSHLNPDDSLLTSMQAFQLNVHFTVEQAARFKSGYFLQFNGTAGLWRSTCIKDAGGWEADTLTEDLDLSYRAQLRGWRIVYKENVTTPAELPADINALKSQQHRWMKGGAETARKLLPLLWSSDAALVQKIQGTIHLLASTVFVFVFLLGILSVPVAFLVHHPILDSGWLMVFYLPLFMLLAIYFVANVQRCWADEILPNKLFKFVFLFPLFLAFSMGMALHNGIAVLQGWLGKKSAFIRTPKAGNITSKLLPSKNVYLKIKRDKTFNTEVILTLYFTGALITSWYISNFHFFMFHLLLLLGYGGLVYYTLRLSWVKA